MIKIIEKKILSIKLFKDSFFVFGIRIFSLAFQLGVFALITHSHSLSEVGIYAFVNTIWIITRNSGSFGYDQAAMRFIPEYLFQGKRNWAYLYQQIAVQNICRRILMGAGVIVITGIILIVIKPEWQSYCITAFILAAGLPAYALLGLYVCIVRAHGKVIIAQIPESICIQLGMFIGIGWMILAGVESVEYVLGIQLFSVWITIFVYNKILKMVTIFDPEPNVSKPDMKTVNKMAITVFKAMLASVLAARLPLVLLSLAVNSEMLGLFEAALRFGILASIITWAVGVVVSPSIATAAAKSDFHTIQRLYAMAGILQTIPALILLFIWCVFGKDLLGFILGEQFRVVSNTLIVIALATTINAMGSAASSYLLMTKGEKIVQTFSILALIVVLIGVPVGVFFGGIEGAAWALVANALVRDIGMTVIVAKTRKLMPGFLSYTYLKRIVSEVYRRIRILTI